MACASNPYKLFTIFSRQSRPFASESPVSVTEILHASISSIIDMNDRPQGHELTGWYYLENCGGNRRATQKRR